MFFVKANNSAVLPIRNFNCQHTFCYDIFFSQNITLMPDKVNVIDTGIVVNLGPNLLISVKDVNCCGREWHTINKFLFGDPYTNIISVPVITSKMFHIRALSQLAHIQIRDISSFSAICQGRTKHYCFMNDLYYKDNFYYQIQWKFSTATLRVKMRMTLVKYQIIKVKFSKEFFFLSDISL